MTQTLVQCDFVLGPKDKHVGEVVAVNGELPSALHFWNGSVVYVLTSDRVHKLQPRVDLMTGQARAAQGVLYRYDEASPFEAALRADTVQRQEVGRVE